MMPLSLSVRRSIFAMASLSTAWPLAPAAAAQDPDPIIQLLDRDAIPAIRDPRFVPAAKATLRPDEKVLGLVVGGEARAYPLIDMDRHEIVDDVVGGTPVAATW